MKKTLLRIFTGTLLGTLICQAGMALTCCSEHSVMHMPSVGNTAVVLIISLLMTIGIEVLLEKIFPYHERTAAIVLVADLFFLGVVIAALLQPLTDETGKIAYRYPMLAAIALGVLTGELVLRKQKPVFRISFRAPDFSSPESIYALALVILGVVLSFLMPRTTITGIDDESHYRYTLYYSEGIYSAFDDGDVTLFYGWDDSIEERDEQNHVYVESDAFFWTPIRVGYIGPMLGLWTGQLLHLGTTGRFLCGRIGGLLLYALIVYFAIRRLKNGKHLLGLICLAPVSVQYAVTYSYDAWLLAFTALSFAYFFGAIQRPETSLSDKECWMIIGAMTLATWPKMPYAVLLLVLFFMPASKFSCKAQRRKYYLAIVACIVLELIFTMLTSFGAGDVVDPRATEDVSGYGQVAYMLSHPMEFVGTMSNHLLSYLKPGNSDYLSTFFYFGSTSAYLILVPAMVLSALTDNEIRVGEITTRIFGLLILLALVGVISLSMYIVYTPVGATAIRGVQTRYKLQLLFPFFMLLLSGWFVLPKKYPQVYNLIFYTLSIGTLIYNMAVLL